MAWQTWGRRIADVSERARAVVDTVSEFGTAWEGAAAQDLRIEIQGNRVAGVGPSVRPTIQPAQSTPWKLLLLGGLVLFVASN